MLLNHSPEGILGYSTQVGVSRENFGVKSERNFVKNCEKVLNN